MTTLILFLLVIIFLVVAHELGHFLVAKAFGVKVDEFGVGYPPRAKKLFAWRGTLFTLNWLPFGGFVKIAGEDGVGEGETNASDLSKLFPYQKLWKRLLIVVAGILANMVIAVLLYSASFGIGFLASPGDFPGSVPLGTDQTIITDVVPGSPAAAAGIAGGDLITSLSAAQATDVPSSVDDVVALIHSHSAEAVTLSLVHDGKAKELVLTPVAAAPGEVPTIGIDLSEVSRVRLPFFTAFKTGFVYTGQEFVSTITTLGQLVGGLFHGNKALLGEVSGPVGIAKIAGQAYSLGFGSFLSFVALISVNLAVINLFPFPALDGGRIVMEFFASDGKSRIPAKVIGWVNQIGFLLLIVLMLAVTYHDIRKLFP